VQERFGIHGHVSRINQFEPMSRRPGSSVASRSRLY
jgi:hypothetical protein